MTPNMIQCLNMNGQGLHISGVHPEQLLSYSNGDVGVLRPYMDEDGRSYVAMNTGKKDAKGDYIFNTYTITTPSTLLKEEWVQIDADILRVVRPLLRVWGDLNAAGLGRRIPNAMAKPVLQYQSMTEAGEATISMDGLREGNRDRPAFDLFNHPLPITHADGQFAMREVMISRNRGDGIDTVMFEMNARHCAETTEKLTLGTSSSYTYGGGTIYGLTNHPNRTTMTMTDPAVVGNAWTPQTAFTEVLAAIQKLQDNFYNGPYGIYFSMDWTQYLEDDYSQAFAGPSLRSRLQGIEGISFVRKSDYLPSKTMVVFQLSRDVIEALTGQDIVTTQWNTHADFQLNFKTFCIMVPRIRTNTNFTSGAVQTGIVHAIAA